MFYEKEVKSFSELMREVSLLDLDGGIRVFGTYEGKKAYLFVTRSLRGYTVMVYDIKPGRKKQWVPSKRLFVKEFENQKDLKIFLLQVVSKPVKAFVY